MTVTRWRAVMVLAAVLCAGASRAATPEPSIILTAGTHPLIDRMLIAELKGAVHVLHRPERREVVLRLDRPWEGPMSAYGTVLRDEEGKIRIYYRGGGDVDPPEVSCVAISDDGVHFTRPSLKLFKIRGTRENNVVFTAPDRLAYGESHNFAPFLDGNPAAPAETRWKAVALKTGKDDQGENRRMLTVLGSTDGLRWKHLADRPVIRTGAFDSLNVPFFDTAAGQYVCYFRVGINHMRSFARAHSADFLHWTLDKPLVFRPDQDEQWYTNGVTPYPGVKGLYLALPMRFVPTRKTIGNPPRTIAGVSDAVLMSSREGVAWDRTFREAFIRPGPDPKNWGEPHGNNTPLAGIVKTAPGEWSVYWFEHYGAAAPEIRRGTLRADGLASVHAGAGRGEFVTPLLRLGDGAKGQLLLNFATSAVGEIRVAIEDPDGKALPGYSGADCAAIFGDEPARPVSWKGGNMLPVGKAFRLRFVLQDADLYAIEVR